jgi:Clostripain family
VHGAFRYVSHDEDTGDKLYNREIHDALEGLVQDAGFDACLMTMLETADALRDSGSVMLGSEELEPGDGWSYDDFLHPLVADPGGTDAAGLGSLMVEGYRK